MQSQLYFYTLITNTTTIASKKWNKNKSCRTCILETIKLLKDILKIQRIILSDCSFFAEIDEMVLKFK